MMIVICALIISQAWAQVASDATERIVHKHPQGFTFSSPRDWKAQQTEEQRVALYPTDKDAKEAIVLAAEPVPGVARADSAQFVAVMDAHMQQNFPQMSRVNRPEALQTNSGPGILLVYQGASPIGSRSEARFYGVMVNGNVQCILAMGPTAVVSSRDEELRQVFISFSPDRSAAATAAASAGASASDDSPAVQQWMQHLRGKKVTYLSSYSSGSGGGMSSEWHLYLAANGTFTYSSQSSVSIYVPGATGGSNGQNGSNGRWRIYTSGAQVILELQFTDGRSRQYTLGYENGKTFFNRTRVYVTES